MKRNGMAKRSTARALVALIVVAVLATGCGGAAGTTAASERPSNTAVSEETTTAASEQAPTKVAYKDVCDSSNDGKLITTKGYLTLGVIARRDADPTTGEPYWHVGLSRKPGGSGDVSVFIYEGDEPHQMKPVPDQYSPDDLKVTATNGKVVGPQDQVRIVGEAFVGDGTCYIDYVQRIRTA